MQELKTTLSCFLLAVKKTEFRRVIKSTYSFLHGQKASKTHLFSLASQIDFKVLLLKLICSLTAQIVFIISMQRLFSQGVITPRKAKMERTKEIPGKRM